MAFSTTSQRHRRKIAAQAGKLLPPGTTIRDAGQGKAQARHSTGAVVALCVFAAVFVVAVLNGILIYPGGLLVWFVIASIWPQRLIVIADQGIAVLDKSRMNSKPTKVVATVPLEAWQPLINGQGDVKVQLGADHIRFNRRELERLNATVQALRQPAAAFATA